MSYLVLARKYRPKNFSEMVGQSHVVQALSNALGTQRLHHAYLFTGTRGVGKTTVSRILAKSLNCTGPDGTGDITATPCGVCEACTDIDSGRFVDYTELDAASNRGVDEIAQLLEQAVYKPVVGRFKVFMIDEVHMLTNTAFNAMLKTLEEPPTYLKFVLATTDPQKVPATVLSRCLQFNLRPMAPETILEHLVQVLAAEDVSAEPQALRLLARAARGSMRDALSLTDQAIAFGSGALVEAGVRQMLGSVDRSYVYQLLDALARGDGKSIVEMSEVLRLNGLSAASTLEEMTSVLQRMAVLQAVPGIGASDDASDPDVSETARLAQLLPADETQLLYSLCLHGRIELGLAPDEYAALTMVLLRLLPFKRATSAPELRGAVEPSKKPQPEPRLAAPVPVLPPVAVAPPYPTTPLVAEPVPAAVVSPVVPVTPEEPVADPATPAQAAPLGGHWAELVQGLIAAELIAALVRELALQSELQSQEEGVWTLRVERQSLNHAGACDKLLLAIQSLHASQEAAATPALTRLMVEVGPVADTPARRNTAAQTERQRQAEEVIENDPFVQDMVRQWGARVVPGSIRPLAPASTSTSVSELAKPI
ncbi:MAG: DNA polymerase-3 subunit gamma/tau [Litorivivens sp.]|jgi:DNA polymerase-3 subunit gamma/tau